MSLAMFSSSFFVLGLLLLSTAYAQRNTVVLGTCPNQCANLAFTPGLLASCAPLSQLDCLLLPCGNPTGRSYSCRKPSDPLPTIEGIIPGTKVEFEELHVGKPFPLFVDFNAGRVSLPVDIYLLADTTISMRNEIQKVKEEFENLISAVSSAPQFKDPYFGVGYFRDERDPNTDFGFRHLQSLTPTSSLAQQAVDNYVTDGGMDSEEANLVALYKVATENNIGWRKDSRKIIVYFGDHPGHEPTCGPFGTLNRRIVADALKEKKISVVAITASISDFEARPTRLSGCRGPFAEGEQASFITRETNGVLLDANSDNLVEKKIEGVLGLPSILTVDLSDCIGKVESTFVPTLPLILKPGSTTIITQSLTVSERFCNARTRRDNFECTVKYLDSGVPLPPTVLVAKKVIGCR